MNHRNGSSLIRTLIVLFLVFVVIFGLGQAGMAMGDGWGWIFLVLMVISLFLLMGGMCGHGGHGHRGKRHAEERPTPPAVETADVFAAEAERHVGPATIREGRLLASADDVMARLRERFRGTGWTPLLTPAEDGSPSLALLPIALDRPAQAQRTWLHALLFLATLIATTWAGALHEGVNLLQEPSRFAVGLPYAIGLMVILGAHEMGHYLAARRHGMSVSLPYFIPVPFGLGTFGAFISLRSPAPSRRALFDMAVSGPLAGLVFAVPALLVGLPLSQVVPDGASTSMSSMHGGGVNIGSSLLLATLAKISLGEQLVGHTLQLHPLAFAGWLGLIVTALNLLPIGQLDGGHISDAMFGQRASAMISTAAMFALFGLGLFVWSGLLFWAFIVFFIAGRKGLPPLNDLTPLAPPRLAVGWLAMSILAAILMPVPHILFESLGIRCPYL
jgi:membrane-associated protease RseP (regulator of RpoE activity)